MEDLEVGPVIEDAAAGTGEDAPVRAGRILLQVLAEERDQLRMEGHRAGLTARTVLELAALASRATVGPPGAWHGLPRPADGGQAGDPARPGRAGQGTGPVARPPGHRGIRPAPGCVHRRRG